MFKSKQSEMSSTNIQIDVYLKSNKKPLQLLVESKKQVELFYAMLNNRDNDFVVFHQLAFAKEEFKYAFYHII